MARATKEKRHLLIYVHGYNNDMGDVLETAEDLEAQYNVLVVPFSWPANGGGPVSGTTAYLDDKRDARVSMDALNRFLGKVHLYHRKLTETRRDELWQQARVEVGDNGNWLAVQERFSQLQAKDCKVTLNLMCHSMGNYVLKYALRPGSSQAAELIFDNISLVAADANNEAHAGWVERLQVRNRLFVFINENDFALEWSRRKPGDEQRVRLGHYLRNLVARNARYIDVTHADGVDDAHGYFLGGPIKRNADLKAVFTAAFEGGRAEEPLHYAADLNAYRLS
jgi:esterase/lipase superfamily enzyme